MVDQGAIHGSEITAEFAATLPRYDPLAREKGTTARRTLMLISLLIHGILLLLFWDMIVGVVIEKEETVVVKMLEEKKPEPPKLRRKVLQQRVLDASVQLHKQLVQREITKVKPVPVLDQVKRVEVEPIKLTEAPKQIEHKQVVTKNVSVFSEREAVPQPVQISQPKSITQIQAAKPTAGPRRLKAASPTVTAKAASVTAPTLTRGVISNNAVAGDVEGAEVADIESGTSDRFLKGDGDRGVLSGEEKDCRNDPICVQYLKEIERRVYARWEDSTGGRVKLRFRIDRGGSAHSVSVSSASNDVLGETCLAAFRRASPFPPPPKSIHYIINKNISANFTSK
ncbi:MAG: TonB family protein [bacterium]|nr:TonB family protein [bacterium]